MDGKNSEKAELAEELFPVLSSNYDIPGLQFVSLRIQRYSPKMCVPFNTTNPIFYHVNGILDPPPQKCVELFCAICVLYLNCVKLQVCKTIWLCFPKCMINVVHSWLRVHDYKIFHGTIKKSKQSSSHGVNAPHMMQQ